MSAEQRLLAFLDEVDGFHIIDTLKDKTKGMIATAYRLGLGEGLGEAAKTSAANARAEVLDAAKQAVCQDRNAAYGEPIDNLGRWSGMCNAAGYQGPDGRDLKPHDMAVIMGLGKYARIMESPDRLDHWVDAAGYPAIGWECVTLEGF